MRMKLKGEIGFLSINGNSAQDFVEGVARFGQFGSAGRSSSRRKADLH